ncbi:MAG: glutamate racemase [Erysipelotrichaceae bacterium]|nr:glutamate racemase [Erysipelotrichaceae bacterium]
MNDRYIGIFDSGVGGLTVVRQILDRMPDENIVFLADNKNVPYGDKEREQIVSYSLNNVGILGRYDLKAIVIACNTSDSISHGLLEEYCDVPVFGVIAPAVQQAAVSTANGRIAVLATNATVRSGEYERQLKDIFEGLEVTSIACPELVPLIEQGSFREDDEETVKVLERYLETAKDADMVILGCTHYDLLYDMLKKMRPDVNIVSSSRCVADVLQDYLEEKDMLSGMKKEDIYLTTKKTERLDEISSLIINDIDMIKTDA